MAVSAVGDNEEEWEEAALEASMEACINAEAEEGTQAPIIGHQTMSTTMVYVVVLGVGEVAADGLTGPSRLMVTPGVAREVVGESVEFSEQCLMTEALVCGNSTTAGAIGVIEVAMDATLMTEEVDGLAELLEKMEEVAVVDGQLVALTHLMVAVVDVVAVRLVLIHLMMEADAVAVLQGRIPLMAAVAAVDELEETRLGMI